MEEDKPAIEILKDYASQTGRKARFQESDKSTFLVHSHIMHGRIIYFPDRQSDKRYFAAYSNPRFFGIRAMYSGVFIPVDLPESVNVQIRKKTIFDRLRFLNMRKTYRFDERQLDRKLLLTGEHADRALSVLHDPKIQHEIYEFMMNNPRYWLLINDIDISYIPEFKTGSYLGFLRANWELDGDEIEHLFRSIKRIEKLL
ncbi:MAG: hypothetical protein PF489_14585 [Salinivirgaceae bacterium]|jgi:hypothetical protein|nr:hypothetical protein [Salinivirgaceae bacterium]